MENRALSTQLQNIHLRRIEWAISSPDLMDYPFCANYFRDATHKDSVSKLLAELDAKSEAVHAHFNGLRHMPMGKYFEQLLLFILDKDPRFEVLLANHQIIEDKTTIGELDIILKDLQSNTVQHWEICLKYYLQSQPTTEQQMMLGPGAKDNMDRKVRKLIDHQIKLSQHPSIKYLIGTENIESKLFMKGQLFYHLGQKEVIALDANPRSETGYWCFHSGLKTMLSKKHKYLIINKPNWIEKQLLESDSELDSLSEITNKINIYFNTQSKALLLVGLSETPNGWEEQTRGFIVADGWPLIM
ncbi:MAG: hypothetical protein ACI9UR_001950 [Bacteroidia bacterium]